jgi:PPK2 family polyphosphate:nucleotide phosphotransferase
MSAFQGIGDRHRVDGRARIRLDDFDPDDDGGIDDQDAADERRRANVAAIAALQYRLYAENRRSLLVVLQAMDTGGKDGTIRRVFSGVNPQGCEVTSFKVPSEEERDHGFLWRIHKAVPRRGNIGIFNRSHYEDVLVARVHGLIDGATCRDRYAHINDFERVLVQTDVTILKFFLHISRAEQTRRLQARIDDPERNWKFSPGDLAERRHWDDYQRAYEDAINECSTPAVPWFIVPADRKWHRNLVISEIVRATLDRMNPRLPAASPEVRGLRLE